MIIQILFAVGSVWAAVTAVREAVCLFREIK